MSTAPVRTPRRRSPAAGPAPARPPLRPVPDGPARPAPRRRNPAARPAPKPRPGSPATTPLGIRLLLLPVRLLLVPVRLAVVLLTRLTGGRPWLVLILALGCGVIALHAATLQTNQAIEVRGQQINALERSTATLRNDVAELGAPDRVSTFGREAGMVLPDPEGIGYLDARTVDPARASGMIAAPSATWKPAPNVSEQNGDLPAAEGTATTDGAAGAGTTAPAAAGETTDAPATGAATGATAAEPAAGTPDPAAATRAPEATGTGASGAAQAAPSGSAAAAPPTSTAAPSAEAPQTGAPAPVTGGGTAPPGD